jgi:hypothetical protein
LHRIFYQRPLDDVEFLTGEQIVETDGGAGVERGIAFWEVGTEFFEEFDGAVEGFRGSITTLRAAFGEDACGFVGVVFGVVVVEFWIVLEIPVHVFLGNWGWTYLSIGPMACFEVPL